MPSVPITRLSGGLSPADGSDPRTFPLIFNEVVDAVEALPLQIYPVGSIYMSVVNTNPSTLFGGTWVEFGSGRVVVGVDTGDADFDTEEKTGGAKTHTHTTPVHSHTTPSHVHSSAAHSHRENTGWDQINRYFATQGSGSQFIPFHGSDVLTVNAARPLSTLGSTATSGAARLGRTETVTPGNTGGASPTTNVADVNTNASSSVQPYITAYMFKRTA